MYNCKGKDKYDCEHTSCTPYEGDGLCDSCWSIENFKLSEPQLKAIKEICPHCEDGRLHAVDGEDEIYLWCNNCDLTKELNKEKKVYVINCSDTDLDFHEWERKGEYEPIMTTAEELGTVYSLQGFQDASNDESLDLSNSFILIN